MITRRSIYRFMALLLVTGTVEASDGVFEINAACVADGCFAGDSGGFPVELTSGQSYRLTSNLTVPDVNTKAITGSNVQLDLNGFTISGPVFCSGQTAVCDSVGSGHGVESEGRLTIFNGAIKGVGGSCLSIGKYTVVRNVRLEQCGADGITPNFGGEALQVLDSQILRNAQSGINIAFGASDGILIKGNTIFGNGGAGIRGNSSTVLDNSVTNNGGLGLNAFFGGSGTSFARNTFIDNNGGNANDQTRGGTEIGINFCGDDTTCP